MSKNFLKDMDMVKMKHRGRPEPLLPLPAKNKDKLRPRAFSRRGLWGVAVISLLFFLFALSYFYSSATVTVSPKIKDVTLNENLSASREVGGEALPFDVIVISGEETKMVQTTEQKDVAEKATGVVVIYNAFSSAPQKLSIDTRLEGSNGKIYKTKKALVVPGMNGKTPGSLEADIYGSNAGEEYNSDPLDFTIFGFKGTAKYSKFYGRSKGEITGGFKGKAPIISDADKLTVTDDLKKNLQTKLFQKATGQIPSGFVLFKDAVFLNLDDSIIDRASAKDNMLSVMLKGTLYGFLFNEEKLTAKIAEDNITGFDGSPVYLLNIRDLIFSLSDKDNISLTNNLADVKNIDFNLSGETKIIWKIDENKLSGDLLGKAKKDFKQIFSQYPDIDSADLSISPFWKMSLPDKAKNIKVIVNYPAH